MNLSMYKDLLGGRKKISVLGLGYVGLPIALEFARHIPVIGFDIRPDRIDLLRRKIDPSNELGPENFENTNIEFASDPEKLREASFHIVAVPTPIDEHNQPDLQPLLAASITVGKILKKGDYVVYESTVYPGCTEEDCVPILERESGLVSGKDFRVGFSPERINPGDKKHTLTSITKVVSGNDSEALENIARVYEKIITAGIHRASSIKVAEAAKIIENSQRDIHIAFMNELSIIFNRMGINTYEVLEAAATKWNFLQFSPGLVGGHCIGVDPYYLTYKARELGYHSQIINSGRFVNDSMGGYVAKQIVKKIIAADKNIKNTHVLIMGITFKENVSDIRNSKVVDVFREFRSFGVKVDVVDPKASSAEVMSEYGITLNEKAGKNYDAVVVAVNHREYLDLAENDFVAMLAKRGILADLKGIYRGRIHKLTYWSM